MRPSELNILIAAVTNHFYCNLSEKEFINLGIFLSLLSKDMLSMEVVKKYAYGRKRKKSGSSRSRKKKKRNNWKSGIPGIVYN